MQKTLALLVTSSALGAAIGLPDWSAIDAPTGGNREPFAALFEDGAKALPLILVSDDDDDDDRGYRKTSRRGHDDDDDENHDDDDDHVGRIRNPAAAGTVAPPKNGLFGNGAAPKVQVN